MSQVSSQSSVLLICLNGIFLDTEMTETVVRCERVYVTALNVIPLDDQPLIPAMEWKAMNNPGPYHHCPIIALDHLEFYVGNAKQASYVYEHQFGFTPIAFRGLETGYRKAVSYVLQQGGIRFVITSGFDPSYAINQSVALHGDGVAIMAFAVTDVGQVYNHVVQRGAKGVIPPTDMDDDTGHFRFAAIQGYGNVVFKFVERQHYGGLFEPGFVLYPGTRYELPSTRSRRLSGMGLTHIDHVVGNVAMGAMDPWVDFFIQSLGFQLLVQFDQEAISTQYSALRSKVVQTPTGSVKLPINEPAWGQRQSQIEEYLQFNQGPGVQHIALSTPDIIQAVRAMKQAGVDFLMPPSTYYDELTARVGTIDEPINQLAELGILVDRDEMGYLLQIFTQPVGDRPTLFFEVIQRHRATSFGEGNFKALFEAIEREQARRGNL